MATGVWRLGVSRAAARVTIAVALMGQISLALGAAAGGWQVDIHMAYFAGVALVAVYCDPIALAAATLTVALHHLSLNFLLPEAIYPGGSDIGRVLLHAVILLIEAGGLIWMSAMISAAFDRAEAAGRRADEAVAAAEAAAREAEGARLAERREAESRHAIQAQMSAEQGVAAALLASRLAEIADGDLTARISEALEGKYADIKTDFNAAIGKLQVALGAVDARAVSVRAGAMRFAEAAEALSERSEQQASEISRTMPSLERVSDLIKRSTKRANGARELVLVADAEARQSGEVVGKAVEAMAGITESSARIGQIIGVIDEIAFQTNLLALNAGVEAARAGNRARFRGRRLRGARARPAFRASRQGNQGAHFRLDGAGGSRRRSGDRGRRRAAAHRAKSLRHQWRGRRDRRTRRKSNSSACPKSSRPSARWTHQPSRTSKWRAKRTGRAATSLPKAMNSAS